VRKSVLALAVLLALSACASLQIPVNLDPGEYREGTYLLSLPYGVRKLDARLLTTPLTFDPPRPSLTYASLDAALEVTVQTSPAAQGSATALLYLAPAEAGGGCTDAATYKDSYEFAGGSVPLGTPATVTLQGALSPDQLAGLNAGRLCLGVVVRLNANDYINGLLVSWRFVRLRVGVGIL